MASRAFFRVVAPVGSRQFTASSRAFSAKATFKATPKPFALALGVAGAAGLAVLTTTQAEAPKLDQAALKAAIIKTIDDEDARRADGTSLGPTLVRLAWHCAGTFCKADGTGGSNGCRMRFKPEAGWGANAGLATARNFLDPIAKQFPGVSHADLYTYAGAVAVENMGGPAVPFAFGRADFADGTTSPPDGRLPNADMGSPAATAQHLRDIFYRMGFNDKEIVALSGAHAMGRCHQDASGYWGPWTNAESSFSNDYFRLLKEEKWTKKATHGGCPWAGPEQFENPDKTLMMLPSDLVLVSDPSFDAWVTKYKDDEKLFAADFAAAFGKLLALGVKAPAASAAPGAGGAFLGQFKGLFKALFGL